MKNMQRISMNLFPSPLLGAAVIWMAACCQLLPGAITLAVVTALGFSARNSALAANTNAQATLSEKETLHFRAVERDSPKPLPGVSITATITIENKDDIKTYVTDAEGNCKIRLPEKMPQWITVQAKKEGFVPMATDWNLGLDWNALPRVNEVPHQCTLTLERGASIGGIIEDENGKPIPHASILLSLGGADDGRSGEWHVDVHDHRVMTDAKGQWRCANAPADLKTVFIHLIHPDYVSDALARSNRAGWPYKAPLPPIEKLRDMSGVMVMRKPLVVRGKVTDAETRQPIASFKVIPGTSYGSDHPQVSWQPSNAIVFRQGSYEFAFSEPYTSYLIRIEADGYEDSLSQLMRHTEAGITLNFQLKKGKRMRRQGDR